MLLIEANEKMKLLMILVIAMPLFSNNLLINASAQLTKVTPHMHECIAKYVTGASARNVNNTVTNIENCILSSPTATATTAAITSFSIPTSMDPVYQHNFDLVGKPFLYFNNTDGHYHLKGALKSVAKYTLGTSGIIVDFNDRSTNLVTKAVNGPNRDNINPGDIWNFDVDTTYTKNQGN